MIAPFSKYREQAGVTLVELIVAIVVIGISVSGVLLVMNYTTRQSADPMIRQQAVAIAESYLEEILLKPFTDPDGSEVGEGRSSFDDVDDYNGLDDSPPVNSAGAAVANLNGYRVRVTVGSTDAAGAVLGPSGDQLSGNSGEVLRIDVRVTFSTFVDITLTGFRADY